MTDAIEKLVTATVTYRPCANCNAMVPIRVVLPEGQLSRPHAVGTISCSPSCRTQTSQKRRKS